MRLPITTSSEGINIRPIFLTWFCCQGPILFHIPMLLPSVGFDIFLKQVFVVFVKPWWTISNYLRARELLFAEYGQHLETTEHLGYLWEFVESCVVSSGGVIIVLFSIWQALVLSGGKNFRPSRRKFAACACVVLLAGAFLFSKDKPDSLSVYVHLISYPVTALSLALIAWRPSISMPTKAGPGFEI